MSSGTSSCYPSLVDTPQGQAVRVPLQYFLKRILPPLRHEINPPRIVNVLSRSHKRSSPHRLITLRKRWRGFAQDPDDSSHSTKTTFRTLGHLVQCITKASGCQATPIAIRHNPATRICDFDRDHTSLPDVYLTACDEHATWQDIVAFGELRKEDTVIDVDQNVMKVTRSMSLCMHYDPRRRSVYAFTIENTSMRLWYCDRTQVLVSEPFNFITDHQPFVHFFLSVIYANQTDLGFDPTMQLRGDDHYDITTCLEDGTIRTYRTLQILSNSKTVDLVGRGTRVWKVIQVEDGQEVGEPMVLKDTWSDPERSTEGYLLEKVRAAERSEDHKASMDKLFPTMICHGDVYLDDEPHRLDCTPSFGPNAGINSILRREDICRGEEGYGPWESDYTPRRQRVHYRLVFREVCKPLSDETSLSKIYRALGDAALALQVMHTAGWVHRDVSAGNILIKEDGSILLTDLELAKEMGTQDEHAVGTPGFIAAEVQSQTFLFLPIDIERAPPREKPQRKYTLYQRLYENVPRDKTLGELILPPRRNDASSHKLTFWYNPLHDLESLWWLSLYFAVKREIFEPETPEEDSTVSTAHRAYVSDFFENAAFRGSMIRQPSLLVDKAEGILPPIPFDLVSVLEELLRELTQKYIAAEKNASTLDRKCADGLHEIFQQTFHELADIEVLCDMNVRPFAALPVRNSNWLFQGYSPDDTSSCPSSCSSAKRARNHSDAEESGRTKRARFKATIVPDTAPGRLPCLPRRAKERSVRR